MGQEKEALRLKTYRAWWGGEELLLHRRLRPAQPDVYANNRAVDVDAEILILRLRQVSIGYVHVSHSGLNAGPGAEVIACSAAHHQGERQVLALGIQNPVGPFGIDVPGAAAHFIVRNDPPVAGDKVTPDPVIEGEVSGLGPSRNDGG